MATYWVSSSPKGLANGSSYDNAIGDLPSALALLTVKGDILNVIADGNHTWPTSETTLPAGTKGTSFSDYGQLIRGVTDDDTENPALAEIVASGADGPRYFFRVIADMGYVIGRNLKFDCSGKTGDTGNSYYCSRLRDTGSPDPGPIRFEGCAFIGAASGSGPGGTRQAVDIQTTAPPAGTEIFQILDSYFQNWDFAADAGATLVKKFQGCLFYNDDTTAAGSTFYSQTLAAGTGGTFQFVGNTIYESVGNNTFGAPLAYVVSGALDAGTVDLKDNLVFLESTNTSPAARFISDSGPASGSYSGTIDYNVLLGGPNLAVGDLHGSGWYEGLWDVSPANDQYAYEQAEATIFLDPASTYAWDALDNGVTITILKDLRPKLYTNASESGGAVGALPAGETDLSVTNTSDRGSPKIDETVVFTIVASNSGSDDSNVQVTASLPSGLTYVSSSATAGSYDSGTGIWTIGDLDDAASETLTLTVTVDSDQAGETLTLTATISGDLDESSPSNNSASAVLTVVAEDVGDGGGPGSVPFIDTFPIYATDLRFDMNVRFRTKQNRAVEYYLRKDIENRRWREITMRRITVATNTTTTVNLGGIQRAEFLLAESDEAVQFGIGNASVNLYPASKAVALVVSDFERLDIKNPSTTAEATVLLVVID